MVNMNVVVGKSDVDMVVDGKPDVDMLLLLKCLLISCGRNGNNLMVRYDNIWLSYISPSSHYGIGLTFWILREIRVWFLPST